MPEVLALRGDPVNEPTPGGIQLGYIPQITRELRTETVDSSKFALEVRADIHQERRTVIMIHRSVQNFLRPVRLPTHRQLFQTCSIASLVPQCRGSVMIGVPAYPDPQS